MAKSVRLSQDNSPASTHEFSSGALAVLIGVAAFTLLCGAWAASSNHLQWKTTSIAGNTTTQSALLTKTAASSKVARSQTSVERSLKELVINRLTRTANISIDKNGLPVFYQTILKSEKPSNTSGLVLRTIIADFGYDQQDIFTGKVPGGSYVLHCQKTAHAITRAMCWRELQTSHHKWVQYRFPRKELKNWWKIEQKVLEIIG